MGADFFITAGEGATLKEAFAQALAQANWEHGHGGYSGTLAEKDSAAAMSTTLYWDDEVTQRCHDLMSDERVDDKWGPAGALAHKRVTRTETVTVEGPHHTDWEAAARGAAHLAKGESIEGVRLRSQSAVPGLHVRESRTYEVSVRRAEAGQVRTKEIRVSLTGEAARGSAYDVHQAAEALARTRLGRATVLSVKVDQVETLTRVVTTTGGREVRRYVVEGDHAHDTYDRGFATRAEALARAKDLAAQQAQRQREGVSWVPGAVGYEVVSMGRGTDGAALARVELEVRRVNLTLTVRYVTGRKRPTGTPDGWTFFGWASS